MSRSIKFRVWDGKAMNYAGGAHHFCVDQDGIVYMKSHHEKGLVALLSTGLKDKNGKEIYEGDVLSECNLGRGSDDFPILARTVVTFVEGAYECDPVISGVECIIPELSAVSDHVDIIGNRYEHPELLNKEAK